MYVALTHVRGPKTCRCGYKAHVRAPRGRDMYVRLEDMYVGLEHMYMRLEHMHLHLAAPTCTPHGGLAADWQGLGVGGSEQTA